MFIIPRSPRKKSNIKVYHIILRGINRQDIFLDKQDFRKFLKEVRRTKKIYQYELYAYVLMPNHTHFIVYDVNDNISTAIQSLTVAYSYYFNKKYERSGHLFENRFKSKFVDKECYLKNLLRYIHKNPENAGIKGDFPWNSYFEYIHYKDKLADKKFIMNLFHNDISNFKNFHNDYRKNQDVNKDYELISKIEDEEAIKLMKGIAQEDNLVKIQNYDTKIKYEIIKKFIKIEGIKKVQIARILGINRKTIERIEKEMSQKGQITH